MIIILVNDPLFALSQLLFVDFLHSDRQETFCLAPFRSSPLPKYVFLRLVLNRRLKFLLFQIKADVVSLSERQKKKSKNPMTAT